MKKTLGLILLIAGVLVTGVSVAQNYRRSSEEPLYIPNPGNPHNVWKRPLKNKQRTEVAPYKRTPKSTQAKQQAPTQTKTLTMPPAPTVQPKQQGATQPTPVIQPEVVYKPIIYLYPETKTEVQVKVGRPDKLTHTYPKYNGGWQVSAEPNGDLVDKNGRGYYALYWEGVRAEKERPSEGFIVPSQDVIPFLEEKLDLLGLTEHEANEFIVYWLPKLESNPYNFIRFQTKAEIDASMPLEITPKPATVIRVMMEYDDAEKGEKVAEQILPPTPQRTGFTVVEWGGTELD